MSVNLKPLDQQVIVITGSSSGIGLATAIQAVEAGAKVVLAARSTETLEEIVARLNEAGPGHAVFVTADVTNRSQLEAVAERAVQEFGEIDTWVNNAGVSIYGRLDEVSEEDSRQLFNINFWGVVNGSLVALPHLKRNGGALINLGSEVSEAAMPLLGMYAATKHAVKGFTDSLRIEVEEVDKAPVSITLIQPTATNTPFPQHAKNYLDVEPKLPSPIIDPHKVATVILEAAVSPTRAEKVGAMSKVNTMTAKFLPGMGDKMAKKQVPNLKHDMPPTRNRDGILYKGGSEGNIYGDEDGAQRL